MAYNNGRENRKWLRWKEAEEKILRECGVDETTIEQIRTDDRAEFNSDRRYYSRKWEVGSYLEDMAEGRQEKEVGTVDDLLDEIESENLYQVLVGFSGEKFTVTMKRHLTYTAELSDDVVGNIVRINNALEKIPQSLDNHRENLERLAGELESAREEAERPFPQEAELAEKSARLTELNTELDNEERNRGKGPEKDDAKQDSREKGSAPGFAVGDNNMKPDAEKGAENRSREGRVAENSGWEDTGGRTAGGKPSILAELRQHERTVPVPAGRVQSRGGEAI